MIKIGKRVIKRLRGEGNLAPIISFKAEKISISLDLTPNATFLVEVG